jgi:hypothetical protein
VSTHLNAQEVLVLHLLERAEFERFVCPRRAHIARGEHVAAKGGEVSTMRFPAAAGVVLAVVANGGSNVTISNTRPRVDTAGVLMDAHDGMITTVAGLKNGEQRYVWYGMGYRNCTEKDGLLPPFQVTACAAAATGRTHLLSRG